MVALYPFKLARPGSRPGTARTNALGSKAPAPSATAKAPETLPPGPPLQLNVVWVPCYIIRAPFSVAAQFFTQMRARVYVLSGECLHPITGEALIAGISKWSPDGENQILQSKLFSGV